MVLAIIKTTAKLKFRGCENGHCEASFVNALIC